MKRYYFKTICLRGITHTCEAWGYNIREAMQEAYTIFGTYYPEHGYINYMSERDYKFFHKL